ncbi:MAG: Gmad2 immunoglobulin-like domain-containing protein [Candidatus Pacebacteria bacterium]|nr:Gmad2 immunoglobulin-like domain-containing protein [Candidatus Paceibacterota bacterium]
MNKKTLIVSLVIIIALGIGACLFYFSRTDDVVVVDSPVSDSITYTNTNYGFTFTLPVDWQGYSIVANTWNGTALTNTVASSGPKLLIRNPKWTPAAPYEDLPILVFTIPQWNSYLAGNFSISAAPILASELARNNKYVFALPPRWDYDYSTRYQQAQSIIASDPLHTFNVNALIPSAPQISYTNSSSDMIVVDVPFPGAVTGKEFSVIGKARGTWFFEASFPIVLLDKGGKVLATGIAQAGSDWMTTDFVPFKADIKVPQSYIGPATLVFKRDNPSGEASRDASISFDITVEY